MEQPELSTDKRLRPKLRALRQALRPLLWWLAFVLLLFGIHTHELWMERTRIGFSLSLDGQRILFEALATLDGRGIATGDRLSLGLHTFAITNPKVEPFSTNLFIWYGGQTLGNIDLKRANGTLTIRANPPALALYIRGPEFAVTLTNSAGTNMSVPTDRYTVEAEYPHSREAGEATVLMNVPGLWSFAPRLGSLRLSCKRAGASFRLLKGENEIIEGGNFPKTIQDVPEGRYNLVAMHDGNRVDEALMVTSGMTNIFEVQFKYGTAIVETEPPAATVMRSDGRDYDVTPCSLSELLPGNWRFILRKDGYEPVEISLLIAGQETNTFRTNLISRDYTGALKAGREYLVARDYDRALEAARDALRVKPDDATAKMLEREATGLGSLRRAEELGQQRKYALALQELDATLKAVPENERAHALLKELREREAEEAEKVRLARLSRPREVFAKQLAQSPDSTLFDSHELRTKKKAAVVSEAILMALRGQAPAFTIGLRSAPEPDVTVLVAKRESWSQARMCVVVIGQISDEETQILFEVMEYKVDVASKVLGGILSVGASNGQSKSSSAQPDLHTPLHASRVGPLTEKMKTQIEEGVRILTERIQLAVGRE